MRKATVIALVIAAGGIGAAIGYGVESWKAGGFVAALAAAQVVAGALRRGATRGGTASLVIGAGLLLAGLALVPGLGYLEAVALPALALRLRRMQPERYAGLRTLAKE
jgi:hypothetical protein